MAARRLDELVNVTAEQVHTDRLYKAARSTLAAQGRRGNAPAKAFMRTGFELKCDLLLYDVTSTYFEGEMEGCPIAEAWLHSRDSQGDRPQVCIGLVVTEDGSLGYEVFAGNTHDSKTVQSIIESMEKKHGALKRVWVMDRGMVSEENLKYLRERGAQYIVGTPKAMLRQFEQHLLEANWSAAQDGVEVKLVDSPDGQEIRSGTQRPIVAPKEQAMHEKFTTSYGREGLRKLQTAAESGRLKDEATAGGSWAD